MKLNRHKWNASSEAKFSAIILEKKHIITLKEKKIDGVYGFNGKVDVEIEVVFADYWASVHPFYLVCGRGNLETE